MQVKSIVEWEHSVIHLTFIKLPFVIKIFILSIFELPVLMYYTMALISLPICAGLLLCCLQTDFLTIHDFSSCTNFLKIILPFKCILNGGKFCHLLMTFANRMSVLIWIQILYTLMVFEKILLKEFQKLLSI